MIRRMVYALWPDEQTNKWYIHNPEYVLDNVLWDFETQIDQIISVRRPGLVIVNEKRELGE